MIFCMETEEMMNFGLVQIMIPYLVVPEMTPYMLAMVMTSWMGGRTMTFSMEMQGMIPSKVRKVKIDSMEV